jgi:hypothetical protein
LWRGYESRIVDTMMATIATPEKALFDRLWWREDIIREQSRFDELRLEMDELNRDRFISSVDRSQSPKMRQVLSFLLPLR